MKEFGDDCEDLPFISVNSADSDEFNMPEANVIASQRLLEASTEEEIQRMRAELASVENGEEIGSDNELVLILDSLKVEGPKMPTQKYPGRPTFNIEFLKSMMSQSRYDFLDTFLYCLSEGNVESLDKIIKDLLNTIEKTLCIVQDWKAEDVLCLGVLLSFICLTHICRYVLQHMPIARTLLFYLLDDRKLADGQANKLGYVLTKIFTKPEDRLELATILDIGPTDISLNISKGVVRLTLREMLTLDTTESADVWITTPFRACELLPLISSGWRNLDADNQLIALQLLSTNLVDIQTMLDEDLGDGDNDDEENIIEEPLTNEELAYSELFNFLNLNTSRGPKDYALSAENRRLQAMVSKVQLQLHNTHMRWGTYLNKYDK